MRRKMWLTTTSITALRPRIPTCASLRLPWNTCWTATSWWCASPRGDPLPDKVWDPKNEQEVSYPLTAISVLPYFGAGSVEDQGYMFVPDGAGALIYFNRTSPLAEPYSRRVYGQDHAAIPPKGVFLHAQRADLSPVFGVVKNEQAFLAIIEEGDAAARIEAMLPGMRDSYNKVWASFEVRSAARVNMQAEGELIHLRQLSILMYQARLNQSDTAIRYVFLPREESSYAGMARAYQDYLVEKHGLSKLDPGGKLPLIVDVIGSFDHVQPVLGIPTNVVDPLPPMNRPSFWWKICFAEGVDSLRLRYLGWLRGGIRHVYPRGAPGESGGQQPQLAAAQPVPGGAGRRFLSQRGFPAGSPQQPGRPVF